MKKLNGMLSSLVLLTATQSLVAEQTQPSRLEESVTQPSKMITPTVAPQGKGGIHGIFSADFIWWKTHIEGMEYVTTGMNDAGGNVPHYTNVSKGNIHQADFDFKPGFKLGLGIDFAHDGWDLMAEYTWLQGGENENSFTSKPGKGAATTLSVVDPRGEVAIMSVQSGSSKWEQHFNVVDLMLERNFFVSRYLTLKPSIGLKTAWIEEEFKMHFKSSSVQFLSNGVSSAEQLRNQHMWGLGPRIGLDSVWHFCKHWGVYGNLEMTGLWSNFHTRAKTKTVANVLPAGNPVVTTTNLNTRESVQKIMPVLEGGIGLTYMTWYHNDHCMFQIQAGWETQVWLDFNHFVETTKGGNLSLQGLTLQVLFAF